MQELRFFGRRVRQHKPNLERSDILNALRSLGDFQSTALLVHSSLSACGWISGGPQTVIDALRDWISGSNLVMPTHTYCYPGADGKLPLFSTAATPSLVGAITEHFRASSGVIRSCHPSHSIACSGPWAEKLCCAHDACETPCGPGTPYARLIEADCAVLLFGARMDSYTFFHSAEHDAGLLYQYFTAPSQFLVRCGSGPVRRLEMKRQDIGVDRCFEMRQPWFEERKLLKRIELGMGELLYVPHAGMAHAALVAQLHEDPFFLVTEEARDRFLARAKLRPASVTS
jgi:aminoglycoside 3-N-acetyltransferase